MTDLTDQLQFKHEKIQDFDESLFTEDQLHLAQSRAAYRAKEMAALIDNYMVLYIKKRPIWLPRFLYIWLLKKLTNLVQFKKLPKKWDSSL